MADYDLASDVQCITAVAAVTATSTQTSSALDLQLSGTSGGLGFKALTGLIYVGAGGITFNGSNYIDFRVTHSDDNSTYAAVTGDDVILDYTSSVTNSLPDANGVVRSIKTAHASADTGPTVFGYRGKKRYVKIAATFTGTHGTGTLIECQWVLSHPMSAPWWNTQPPDLA
jgi:hypothetical protein